MKCVEYKTPKGKIDRLSEDEAHSAVREGKAKYTSKSKWKKEVRDKK